MQWFIALLFILAVVFWRLSWCTDEALVAWCRFAAAAVLAVAGLVLSMVELLGWLFD